MTSTTDLLAEYDRHVALLFLVDGIEQAWTDHRELVGYSTGADHDVRLGLQRDGLTCTLAINLRDGQWLDSPAKVTLVDFSDDGELAALFAARATDERQLGDVPFGEGLPVHPTTDLTGRPDLDNQCIGLETIGANGARHQYPVPPGFEVGLEHSISVPSLDIEGAPVTASPIVWLGRRCALYVVLRDHIDDTDGSGSWRPFSEARRIWCGTMRDAGAVSGRRWELDLDGPDSLLRKPLATSMATRPAKAIGEFALVTSGDARTDQIYVELSTDEGTYGARAWAGALTASSVADLIGEVQAEIDLAAAATGAMPDPWEDEPGYSVAMDDEGRVAIGISEEELGPGLLVLILHRDVWTYLGYDIEYQRSIYPKPDDPRAVSFYPADLVPGLSEFPDYWVGEFWTGQQDWPGGRDNDGSIRRYSPVYLGGASVLRHNLSAGGQVIRLDLAAGLGGGTSVANPGQLAYPVASSPDDPTAPVEIDGTPCDRAGVWLFYGKRRYAGSEDVFDERWVGLASWTNGTGQQDGLVSGDSIIVTQWLDPALFGFRPKPGAEDSDWLSPAVAEDEHILHAVPLAMLGHLLDEDQAHIVLQRLLYSTGTSTGWDAPELDPSASITGGDNEPAGARTVPFDGEIADLGLAIPADWIADPDEFEAVAERVDTQSSLRVKVAVIPGYQAEDVCRSLMAPLGWSWHFRDGQFGIWCPSDPLTLADATVVLDRSTARVAKTKDTARRELSQDMRRWQPVDRWVVQADFDPLGRKPTQTIEYQAPDGQYRYRPGEVKQTILAHGHRGQVALVERILQQSRWGALRHFAVMGYPVQQLTPGLDLWPGTIVRLTDPELVDPAGSYGVTNRLAIVTKTQRQFGRDEGRMSVDLLVLGTRSATPRVHAMVGRAWGYDSGTERLSMRDNVVTIAGQPLDAAGFVEPSYVGISAIGGDALIECWQHDGLSYNVTFYGTVTGVDLTPGAAYLQLDSTSGTYYRDRDTIVVLQPTINGANAAWVEALFSPICDEAAQWNDGATDHDGYPWED